MTVILVCMINRGAEPVIGVAAAGRDTCAHGDDTGPEIWSRRPTARRCAVAGRAAAGSRRPVEAPPNDARTTRVNSPEFPDGGVGASGDPVVGARLVRA